MCVFLWIIGPNNKEIGQIVTSSEVVLLFFIIYGLVNTIYHQTLHAEWIILVFVMCFFYLMMRRNMYNFLFFALILVSLGILEGLYGILQYFYLVPNVASTFPISGSFDNPAGYSVALSSVFPFAIYLISKTNYIRCLRIFGVVGVVVFITGIFLAQSRSAIFAVITVLTFWFISSCFFRQLSCNLRTIMLVAVCFFFMILAGVVYLYKKDLANGRLLITMCTFHMIKDEPVTGYGVGGFEKEYMLYQARFFEINPESPYIRLSDNVRHPFNEYLKTIVEYGFIGLMIVIVFFLFIIRAYKQNRSIENRTSISVLIGIAVFSCFSYPLTYPFARFVALIAAANLFKDERALFILKNNLLFPLKTSMSLLIMTLVILCLFSMKNEYRWNKIAQPSLAGKTETVMPDYARLYRLMKTHGLFLYNYGAELNYIGKYKDSNNILKDCCRYMNDMDVQLLLADNYQQIQEYDKAEEHLILAYNMVPVRFTPLYRLALLYQMMSNADCTYNTALHIVNKKVKIPSSEVIQMKEEMKKIITNYSNKQKLQVPVKNKGLTIP